MRLSRRVAVAVVGFSALLAATACSSSDDDRRRRCTGTGKTLRSSPGGPTAARRPASTAWSRSSARTARLQSSSTARSPAAPAPTPSRCWPRGCSRTTRRTRSRRTPGAELTDYINAGQVEDLSADYKDWGLTNAFPQGPDRQPDGRRQDLLGAGEHPPGQRGVEQQEGAGRRRHHRRRRRRWTAFFADLDKLKAKGVDAAGRRARTGPS